MLIAGCHSMTSALISKYNKVMKMLIIAPIIPHKVAVLSFILYND
jgi:hypothetical protein